MTMCAQSSLSEARLKYLPQLPKSLQSLSHTVVTVDNTAKIAPIDPLIAKAFPHTSAHLPLTTNTSDKAAHAPLRVGVVFSGGQAPGGHNVIAGLFDALKALHPDSLLYGFCDGPGGIIKNNHVEITAALLSSYRNQGGFDLLGSGRTKIETAEQLVAAEATVNSLRLDGLIIVGGDDSNTNAAVLAERFAASGCKTSVVGVPKTIDGDLKNQHIEISFGFDSACKVYADTIGNLMRDALSAKKYYFFVKLMGRAASHIALECALQTHPNLTLIGEEVAEKQLTLSAIVTNISDLISARAAAGKDYGVILIPEGLIEFIPEVNALIGELNSLLAGDKPHATAMAALGHDEEKIDYMAKLLSKKALPCFQSLPKDIKAQLLLGRDAHGNVQVSKIETERLLIAMVKNDLQKRAKAGAYSGSFSPQPLFLGYEGRSCLPSNFDCQYCYALGHVAALLINGKASGYICAIKNLAAPVDQWQGGAYPLTALMTIEERHGKPKPVIKKALVDLDGKPFALFKQQRAQWALQDVYLAPGPIQFFGPAELTDTISMTLSLEQRGKN